MKGSFLLALCSVVVVCSAPVVSRGEDFLLYTPKPATGEQAPASPDQGVLVKSVTVQRGDTLKNLSRRHIGVASWFPQVLIFNTIKNPDLIYPGEKLLFPVRPGHVIAGKKAPKRKLRHGARRHQHAAQPSLEQAAPAPTAALDEQQSYQRARRAYLGGDYQKSLDLFEDFLRRHPRSKLAPDASLYRADCLLRLSGA